jgi:hypothetical protein
MMRTVKRSWNPQNMRNLSVFSRLWLSFQESQNDFFLKVKTRPEVVSFQNDPHTVYAVHNWTYSLNL